jgi:hypothetical protein
MGLVCFRLKGPNSLSQNLLFLLNDSAKIHMVPAMLNDKYVIRFCVNSKNANEEDMKRAWEIIRDQVDSIWKQTDEEKIKQEDDPLDLPEITSKMKRLRFGVSKMVSDPRIHHQKKYKRSATTFRFSSDSGKYLARKCSIVEQSEDDEI